MSDNHAAPRQHWRRRKRENMTSISFRLFGAALVGLILTACTDPFAAAFAQNRAAATFVPVANGDMQTARDPVPAVYKNQHGIHYDPREFVGNVYDPSQIGNLLTSKGEQGFTRQTFAETGGDLQVNLSPDGHTMAFASTRYSRTPNVCLQNVDGKAVQLLTQDNMSDMMPAFSPDGKWIAWASDRYGNWDILLQKTDARPDSKPRQLTASTDDEIHPAWSPDGKLLAFSRFNSMDGNWQIWVLDMQSEKLSSLTEGLFPRFKPLAPTAAAPDEAAAEDAAKLTPYTLVYQRNRQRDVPLFSVWTSTFAVDDHGAIDSVGAPMEIVASHEWAAITPCWSPDGRYIAFATVGKSALAQWQARIYKPDDIWLVRVDGTNLTQITTHSAPDWNPYWALDPQNPTDPNGRLYFTSERAGVPNIWSVKPIVADLVAAR
jgi:dipeptidyl aminopeptidase/acylaminoacyl peptidase